jgi:Resolvase, N terminal domain
MPSVAWASRVLRKNSKATPVCSERTRSSDASRPGCVRDESGGDNRMRDAISTSFRWVSAFPDRLGRTVKGLVDFVADLQEQKIQFRSLTDGIDTTTPAGRFFFQIMASLAQMERELLTERTRAGLAAARRRVRVGASGG